MSIIIYFFRRDSTFCTLIHGTIFNKCSFYFLYFPENQGTHYKLNHITMTYSKLKCKVIKGWSFPMSKERTSMSHMVPNVCKVFKGHPSIVSFFLSFSILSYFLYSFYPFQMDTARSKFKVSFTFLKLH